MMPLSSLSVGEIGLTLQLQLDGLAHSLDTWFVVEVGKMQIKSIGVELHIASVVLSTPHEKWKAWMVH